MFKSKSTIQINGVSYSGNNITVESDKIIIDGKTIILASELPSLKPIINISGNVESVSTTSGEITVVQNANNVSSTNGNIRIHGNVSHTVKSTNGNISANKILGAVSTVNGNIKYDK